MWAARASRVAAALSALIGVADATSQTGTRPALTEPLPYHIEEATSFATLPGWAEDDHGAAFAVFRASCAAVSDPQRTARHAVPPPADLVTVCRRALETSPSDGRGFFERHFRPFRIRPATGNGLLTGYYEPEFEGRREADERYRFPLLARPDDLVSFGPGDPVPTELAGLAAARRGADGGLEPYPDRAAIEDGALAGRGLEIVFLADPFEAFLVQVQGSARIRFADGTIERVGFAGRNGYPYTSVGRVLIERGILAREEVDMPRIRTVFAADPALARDVMRRNRSFVFFRRIEGLDPALGPIGAQGLPLTPGRSIAVDRTIHPYGLPFFVSAEMPVGPAVRRLVVAQDTGTAIVGPARVDWFAGWGPEAERLAGLLRHPLDLVVLRPIGEVMP